ncbi:hypothetical protein ASJ33_05635 [Dehalococcoides mccartyi]|jgi:hypothetical protein|uniref:hypothetical protein n=1 Tax=Dehalococcoides mccartyi TaxID=61435 RepID=UPI0004E0404C|nr:hypothetical protein [Dehalococcoides mccartyi]AII58740.1 hypothetical protein X792_05080 [Dehalococcoides mccartyi CG1]APH12670.1 hypothetical protein ASJ33_05635 [Dehalococcoides mccartyi]
MSVEIIGNGLKTRLQTITALKAVFSCSEIPQSVNSFPTALIFHTGTEYDQTMGVTNMQLHHFKVKICTQTADQSSGLNALLDFAENTGDNSVKATVDGDVTLSGKCDTARVIRNSGQGTFSMGGHVYLGTEFEIEVWE